MEVLIRAATTQDTAAILELWQVADAEPTHTDDAAGVGALLAHDSSALLVAETDDEVIGTVIAGWDGWRGSIYRLVVHPRYRRSGVARSLLSEAESRLAERGARRLQAIVVESDAQATGFWRAATWEEQAERLRFVKG
jgi:ribosomal protein S18 acetylase RimI-like enzyme